MTTDPSAQAGHASSPAPPIALVGHCGFDAGSLRSFVQRHAPASDLHVVNRQAELDALLPQGPLLLINRVLDGRFEAGDGQQMIQQLQPTQAAGAPGVRTLLISNFADAQASAEQAGARPGFGKSELGTAKARDRLLAALL